jgi:hypothetical protein
MKDEDGNIIPLFLDIRIALIANCLYKQYSPCLYGRVIASNISINQHSNIYVPVPRQNMDVNRYVFDVWMVYGV